MSVLTDITSQNPAMTHTGWQLFCALARGTLKPGLAWQNPAWRRKFLLRSLWTPLSTAALLKELASHPDLLSMLYAQPGLPCRLHRPWLSLVMSRQQTLAALAFHYQTFTASLPAAVRQNYYTPQGVMLAKLAGKNGEYYSIQLLAEANMDKEGEATLVFSDENQIPLAKMTFALCEYAGKRTLFIGGLQGAKNNVTHDVIQLATKACHGLFPKRLLLEACTELASLWQLESLLAVGNSTHIYRSWRYRQKKQGKLFADYDSFWHSMSGEQDRDGLFHLPLTLSRKPMDDIASKKRAEYRRRYQLLDDLQTQIRLALQA
ncbi:VirK/YbjX family protein [Phytobacter sp. V91]|uniref:VirK/YbjX family protein n=1 Tax=Phytobacter sp. V91 TaxID=3369425 RepID=UPI003F645535